MPSGNISHFIQSEVLWITNKTEYFYDIVDMLAVFKTNNYPAPLATENWAGLVKFAPEHVNYSRLNKEGIFVDQQVQIVVSITVVAGYLLI